VARSAPWWFRDWPVIDSGQLSLLPSQVDPVAIRRKVRERDGLDDVQERAEEVVDARRRARLTQ